MVHVLYRSRDLDVFPRYKVWTPYFHASEAIYQQLSRSMRYDGQVIRVRHDDREKRWWL